MLDADEIYLEARRKFLEAREKRELAASAQRQAAEIESLDNAESMREFIERRKELRHRVFEPDIPLDEASMGDYMKRRPSGRR